MTAHEIMDALKAHFPADAISWRVGSTNKKKFDAKQADKRRGLPLAYIDPRDVMGRLDAVMGVDWQCDYTAMPNGTCCCRIGLKIDGEWRWRSNGAGATDVEGEKGQYSDAFKRAAVLWGIGQYLYGIKANWIELDDFWGIRDGDMPKLQALLVRNGAPNPGASSRADDGATHAARRATPEAKQGGADSPTGAKPTISERASAGVVDPKVAALNAKQDTRRDSEALFRALKLSLENCTNDRELNSWAARYGSKTGAQDGMHPDHRAELLKIAQGMRVGFRSAAA